MNRLYEYIKKVLPLNVNPYSNTLLKWAIAGYIIRLILMPLLLTGDELTTAWISLTLIKNHQWIPSNDPPLVFYVFSGYFMLVQPFLPTAALDFLSAKTGTPSFSPTSMSLQLFSSYMPGAQTFLFITEIPFLICDFATAILLLHFFDSERKSLLAFKLWMLNPVVVYVSFLFGQFDIFAIFFFTLSLYFLKKQRIGLAMSSLGVAGAFKVYSLLFALPLVLIHVKKHQKTLPKIKTTISLLVICLLPLALSLFTYILIPPYYEPANAAMATISSDEFNGSYGKTLYSRGKPSQPFLAGLFLFALDYSLGFKTLASFWDVIYLFPLIYGVLLLGIVFWEKWTFDKIWKVMLIFLLVYYAVTLFHPQWFLWAQPLLILLIAENRGRFLKLYGTFIPLYFLYTLYWNGDAISLINNMGLPGIQVLNLLRSVFSAVCIFTAFLILKQEFVKGSKG